VGNGDEKVLTQADVDALVALVPDAPRAAAPPVSANPVHVAKPQPVMAEPVRSSVSIHEIPSANTGHSSEIIALQKTVADLTRQVSKLANTAQRIDLLEERTSQLAQLIQHQAHNVPPAEEQIAEIQAQLRDLSRHLNERPELREVFECRHCKSKGTVAFLTKCTACGRERWFGWWPRQKAGESESRKKVPMDHKPPFGNN
jgi:uncharacterized coiled-coil protein SlyX